MTVRAVEWKKPYRWGKAIEITEDKVINLRLREENNLIIRDEWDNEIYVDLQLDDEVRPTDAFPVWITTWRAVVDNWWDEAWTILICKTTSWDYFRFLYWDNGKIYIDNWTGIFKQIYLKGEVDALLQELRNYIDTELAKKEDKLTAWANITIQDVTDPVTWDIIHEISADGTTYTAWAGIDITNEEISVDTSWASSWQVLSADGQWWVAWVNQSGWATYTAGNGISIDANDEISVDTSVVATQTDLSNKQDSLTASTWISIDSSNNISNTLPWPVVSGTAPSNPTQWALWYDTTVDVLKLYDGTNWKSLVISGDVGVNYMIQSSNSDPASGTASNIITLVP